MTLLYFRPLSYLHFTLLIPILKKSNKKPLQQSGLTKRTVLFPSRSSFGINQLLLLRIFVASKKLPVKDCLDGILSWWKWPSFNLVILSSSTIQMEKVVHS